jgi:5-(carboxyamino)imidazole ribonucleotide synthase
MFCHAAQAMGYRVCVLDPVADGPAGAVAERQIPCSYEDAAGLDALAAQCAAITTEFENVPAGSLQRLEQTRVVRPAGAAVAIAQDRVAEKRFLQSCGVGVAPFAPISSAADCAGAVEALFPGILKTSRLGYDGKGQVPVADRPALAAAWQALGCVPCILEARLALACEISVIVARGIDGHSVAFPPSENEHRQGILAIALSPARVDGALAARARADALRIADGLAYVGVLCVEMFVLADGHLLANEIAPRPHNSGHATIDSCSASQFEQQVRTLAGMPLAQVELLRPSVMLNLLGELWFDGALRPREPDFARVLAVPGARLHLYGKAQARPGRKMGHVTVLGSDTPQACARAREVAQILGIALHPSAVLAGGAAA